MSEVPLNAKKNLKSGLANTVTASDDLFLQCRIPVIRLVLLQ